MMHFLKCYGQQCRKLMYAGQICNGFHIVSKVSTTKFSNSPQLRWQERSMHNYKPDWKHPKTPELIYVPQIMRWLKVKFKFKYLQKAWDPDFTEGAFIYGSTRAICKITQIIHEDRPKDLNGLVTPFLKAQLNEEMTTKLTKTQKQIINLRPEDIKILVPISVDFISEGARKKCLVTLRVLALKWVNDSGTSKLVLVALQTEFARDYTEGTEPDWTISGFDILECSMLSETPATKYK